MRQRKTLEMVDQSGATVSDAQDSAQMKHVGKIIRDMLHFPSQKDLRPEIPFVIEDEGEGSEHKSHMSAGHADNLDNEPSEYTDVITEGRKIVV